MGRGGGEVKTGKFQISIFRSRQIVPPPGEGQFWNRYRVKFVTTTAVRFVVLGQGTQVTDAHYRTLAMGARCIFGKLIKSILEFGAMPGSTPGTG